MQPSHSKPEDQDISASAAPLIDHALDTKADLGTVTAASSQHPAGAGMSRNPSGSHSGSATDPPPPTRSFQVDNIDKDGQQSAAVVAADPEKALSTDGVPPLPVSASPGPEDPVATDSISKQTTDMDADTQSASSSLPLSPTPSRKGSRFSVNLSANLPSMATNLGISQANSDRAVDMAQDLKKNVYNMWHAWFPTPAASSPSSTAATAGSDSSHGSSASLSSLPERGALRSPASGTQSLSQHHNQRPTKAQRMNSFTLGSKTGQDSLQAMGSLSSTQSPRAYSLDIQDRGIASPSPKKAQQPIPETTQEGSLQAPRPRTADPISSRSSTCAPPSNMNSHQPIYLMGKLYPPSPTQWADFQRDFTSGLIWCTYRHSYAPIKPSNFTTDVGWGCMLRSGQGLLANALAIQFMGRGWNRPVPGDPMWDIYVRILSWFLDDMSAKSPFSVHRIALLGKQLGKNIGEWFGPSTTSQVTKALVHNFPESGLGVYVTTDGVVYKDQVEEAATLKKDNGFGHLLILVTIRLGIDKLNPIYNDAIKATFEFPQSLGIAGGRPSSSYYFVGYQGDDLFYLDPHHSRCVVETKDLNDYAAEDFATYHCETVRKIDINSIDPSMLLAFYCQDRSDFEAFCERVGALNARPGMGSSIFAIGERAPDYGDDMDGHVLSVSDEDDDDLELIL